MPRAKEPDATDDALDRRRMQNRMAQRRFRGKALYLALTHTSAPFREKQAKTPGPT